ncbi:MAG: flagellar hook-associated protein FlgK [Rhodospirillaceae bacterium]
MSLNLALTSAISGLQSAQAGLDIISNNIANVQTEGYTRKQFQPQSIVLAGMGAGVAIGDIVNKVDQNLLRDLRGQKSALGLLSTQNSYYRRVQDTFGTTQSNSSISNQINRMQQDFTTLTAAPETVSQQLAAIQAGVSVARNLSDMSRTVQTLRMNADIEIEQAVQNVNVQLNTIAFLNDQIAFNAATSRQTEDLEDKRDIALNKLSEAIDIRYFKNANGSLTVFTSDGTTLVDSSAVPISHVALTQVGPQTSYAGGDFNGIFAGVRDITSSIRGGKIKALVEMRDNTLPDMQAQIDELARAMKQQVNQVHNRGTSYPNIVNNMTGTRTFIAPSEQLVSFSGAEPTIMLYNTAGEEIAASRLFDTAGINFTNGSSLDQLASDIQTWVQAQDPQLVNASVAFNADGRMEINLGTDVIGIAFRDEESAIKGSDQQDVTAQIDLDGDGTYDKSFLGFSNTFGLNDYFTTAENLSQWDTGFKPKNYNLGIASAVTLQFADATSMASGTNTISTVTINPADTLEAIRDRINSDPLLQNRISADIIPEGSGQRLRIQHEEGEHLIITEVGGTTGMDTLGLNWTASGYAQNMQVSQTLVDDSSRISRGEIKLDPLTGEYLLASGDNTVIAQLATLMSGNGSFLAAGSLSGSSVSFSDYGAAIVSRSSTQAAAADTNMKLQADLHEALELKHSEISGVNLDEEMSQLMVYQQTYAASAKVISTTQQLFDVLNDLIR